MPLSALLATAGRLGDTSAKSSTAIEPGREDVPAVRAGGNRSVRSRAPPVHFPSQRRCQRRIPECAGRARLGMRLYHRAPAAPFVGRSFGIRTTGVEAGRGVHIIGGGCAGAREIGPGRLAS